MTFGRCACRDLVGVLGVRIGGAGIGTGRMVGVMLAEWLAEVMSGQATPAGMSRAPGDADVAIATDEVLAAKERIRSAVEDPTTTTGSCSGAANADAELVLTDTTVRQLVACEGLTVAAASAGPTEVTWPMFRGRALDAFVEHVLFAGPVADAVTDLRSMWTASESSEDLVLLERFTSGEPGSGDAGSGDAGTSGTVTDGSAVAELGDLAAHAMAFSGTGRWVPRTEVRMGARFDGWLELRGRVDVLFGGPGTGLPAVLVEVKSGRIRDEHRAQLRHYVLLAALRHGEVPAGAALWSPGTGLEPLHVHSVVASSAERVAAAVASIVGLGAGREPTLTPGMHCRFCPAAAECPVAAPGSTADEFDQWTGTDGWLDDLGSGGGTW